MLMAASRRKRGSSGRVTPKGGPTNPPPGRRRIDPDAPVQIGRRPSNPAFLLLLAVLWIAVGIVVMVAASFSWRFIPGVVAIGFGLFFLRGAGATVVRREQRRSQP
jgi:hypothetical protein